MKIAITGATGHLGSQVVAHLAKKTDQNNIVPLVHNKNHAQQLVQAGYQIREMDFQDEASLKAALAGIDTLTLPVRPTPFWTGSRNWKTF